MDSEYILNIRNNKNNKNMIIEENNVDSIVFKILQEFNNRAEFGQQKYGTDLDRDDLTFVEWIQHAKEEHMDAILYLEKIRQEELKRLECSKADDSLSNIIKIYNILLVFLCYISAVHVCLYLHNIFRTL